MTFSLGLDINNIGDNRRVQYVRRWYNDGGIMLMNYDKFRSLLVSARRKDYEVMLLKPSLVILDEAHRIKNAATTLTDRVLKIKTLRRICLTGYPLQNNLNEYYCMIDFAYPGLLGDKVEFQTTFRRPIEAVYADSTNSVRHIARSQLLTLQLLTNSLIQR
jgi:SNF2 family DNA or RNA helicase